MTRTQQTIIKNWNKQDKVLEELKNVLIERFEFELYHNSDAYNSISRFPYHNGGWGSVSGLEENFKHLYDFEKEHIISKLLSRTSEGKAVMEFLDVEPSIISKLKKDHDKLINRGSYFRNAWQIIETQIEYLPATLDELLHREFTEALRIGKTFDEAMSIINRIYILHLKDNQ